MLVNEIIEYCKNKYKAYIDYPFGDIPICFKLNNKIFAELYPLENDYKITLKCDPLLVELYRKQYEGVVIRGYHCPPVQAIYRNTVYINQTVSDEIIYEMIDHSYDEVIKSFPRKVQKQILEKIEEKEENSEYKN